MEHKAYISIPKGRNWGIVSWKIGLKLAWTSAGQIPNPVASCPVSQKLRWLHPSSIVAGAIPLSFSCAGSTPVCSTPWQIPHSAGISQSCIFHDSKIRAMEMVLLPAAGGGWLLWTTVPAPCVCSSWLKTSLTVAFQGQKCPGAPCPQAWDGGLALKVTFPVPVKNRQHLFNTASFSEHALATSVSFLSYFPLWAAHFWLLSAPFIAHFNYRSAESNQ